MCSLLGLLEENRVSRRGYPEMVTEQNCLKRDLSCADFVGITASSSEYPDALHIARVAKKCGAKVIAGGIFPSANYAAVLQTGYVDAVVIGEGEETFLELLDAIESARDLESVMGIAFMHNGKVVRTPSRPLSGNLDLLRPAYELLPMREYAKYVSASVYSARGCLGRCEFCTVGPHWNYQYRHRSVKNVISEIALLKKYGFRRVNFKDESLTLDRNHARMLFDALAKSGRGLEYKGKIRIKDVDCELLAAMKKANFVELHFGIESLNNKCLRNIGKELKRDEIIAKTNLIKSMGFVLNPSIILGNPGDTKDSLRELADFIRGIYDKGKVKVYTCINTPHPGSAQSASGKGLHILTGDLHRYTHFHLVSVPQSLGTPEDAVKVISDCQREIVSFVEGPEPVLCT